MKNEVPSKVNITFSSGGGGGSLQILRDKVRVCRDCALIRRDCSLIRNDFALIRNDFALIRSDTITDVVLIFSLWTVYLR